VEPIKVAGHHPCPLKVKEKTFSAFAADLWNSFPELRSAPTRGAATVVAKNISKIAPI
ncbi:Hypothetical protein FKW44_017771, partial [Caligus rogercresseyi]